MGNCLCYDNSDKLTEEDRHGSSKDVKWKSVECGTAGMKYYTKDTMGCPARPQKSRNESDSNKKWR